MTDIYVSDSAELLSALKNAESGDKILLTASEEKYSATIWQSELQEFDTPVTITSADPENPAVIDQLILTRMGNVVIEDIIFSGSERTSHNSEDLILTNCTDILVQNVVFEGAAEGVGRPPEDPDAPTVGGAVYVTGSSNVTITDSDISHYLRGVVYRNNDNLTVSNNSFHEIQEDGMRGGGVNGLLVENNTFSDWLGVQQDWLHGDFIQIWTHSTDRRTENVTIRGNVFDGQGEGEANAHQAIFARNDEVDLFGGDPDLWMFQNFVIENNIIDIDFQGGVKLGFVDGLLVQSNTILGEGRIQISDSQNADILNNITNSFDSSNNVNVNDVNNVILQSEFLDQSDSFDAVISNLDQFRETGDTANLTIRSGSIGDLEAGNAGADPFSFVDPNSGLHLVIEESLLDYAKPLEKTYQVSVWDANGNPVDPDTLEIVWAFGDGSVATGADVGHILPDREAYQVDVQAWSGLDLVGSATTVTDLPEVTLFDLSMADGSVNDFSSYGADVSIDPSLVVYDAAEDLWAFELADTGRTKLDPAASLSLLPVISFEFGFKIDADNTVSGTLLNKQSWLQVNLRDNGDLLIKLIDDETGTQYNHFVQGVDYNDGDWHHMALTFDSVDSQTTAVYLDGVLEVTFDMDWNTPLRDDAFEFGNRAGANMDASFADLKVAAEVWSAQEALDRYVDFAEGDTPDAVEDATGSEDEAPDAEDETTEAGDDTPDPSTAFDGTDTLIFDIAAENSVLVDATGLGGEIRYLNDTEIVSVDAVPSFEIGNGAAVAVDPSIDLSGAETLSMAFFFQRSDADGDTGALFNKQGWFQLNLRDNDEILLKVIDPTDNSVTNVFTAGAELDDTEWHQAVLVFDGGEDGNVQFYLDGTLHADIDAGSAAPDADYDFLFGSQWVDSMEGRISQLQIDSVAWDDTAIQQHFDEFMVATDLLVV